VKYNHAVSISFTVITENEDPTSEEIADRLMEIMEDSHTMAELVESAEVFDTIEEIDEDDDA
jgi:hypothetical protein